MANLTQGQILTTRRKHRSRPASGWSEEFNFTQVSWTWIIWKIVKLTQVTFSMRFCAFLILRLCWSFSMCFFVFLSMRFVRCPTWMFKPPMEPSQHDRHRQFRHDLNTLCWRVRSPCSTSRSHQLVWRMCVSNNKRGKTDVDFLRNFLNQFKRLAVMRWAELAEHGWTIVERWTSLNHGILNHWAPGSDAGNRRCKGKTWPGRAKEPAGAGRSCCRLSKIYFTSTAS